ncbi:hypothetical protein ACFY2W_05320 [Streptomyces sp. NPDC001262]|uniref:hypothetical protein n=1 Tax=Streptomyces sp. NPDC001262 TaxID=3364552 RepID=UPI0036D0D17C
MPNQRTPLPRRQFASVPSAFELTTVLAKVAVFLDKFPELPAPSLTVHTDSVMLQFAFLPSQLMFPSVARVARALGSDTHLKAMSGNGWHFEARGRLQGLDVVVFAAVSVATDPVRVAEVSA